MSIILALEWWRWEDYGQLWLQSKFDASISYMRVYCKNPKQKETKIPIVSPDLSKFLLSKIANTVFNKTKHNLKSKQ